MSTNHPDQPLIKGRFKPNKIVVHLLDHGPFDMNQLAMLEFTDEDRQQFAQLLGYSLGGYSDLGYVTDEAFDRLIVADPDTADDDREKAARELFELVNPDGKWHKFHEAGKARYLAAIDAGYRKSAP
jgi:hypothetical protein